jgi:hypothetical protein
MKELSPGTLPATSAGDGIVGRVRAAISSGLSALRQE